MPPTTTPLWARWLLPNLCVLLTAFTLVYAVFVYGAPTQLFRDSDTGWHIRTGETILQTGRVPVADPYSFSKAGQPWFAWEWAADVMMALAHRAGGLPGVAVLFWLTLGVITWGWVRLQARAGGTFLLTALLAVPFFSTTQLHWLARPHVFGWLLLLGALHLAERRLWWWCVPLALVWANVHGSFFLLPVVMGIYAIGERSRKPLLPAAAALAVTLMNPYGWQLHVHLWRYLTNTELLARIAEFQSFNFHSEGAAQVGLVLLLCLAGAVCAAVTGRYTWAIWLLLLSAMALRSARNLPVAALAGLPFVNAALCVAADRFAAPLREWVNAALAYSQRLQTFDARATGWPLLAVALLAGWSSFGRAGFPPNEFPVAAIDKYLQSNARADWRVFAPDKFGGVLIYRLNGQMPVYFDGRSDFYGAAYLKEYVELLELRPGWRDLLARGQFTHALLPVRYSLAGELPREGWESLYRDENFVLLRKNLKAAGVF